MSLDRQSLFVIGGTIVGAAAGFAIAGPAGVAVGAGIGAGAGGVAGLFFAEGPDDIPASGIGPSRITRGSIGNPIFYTQGCNRVAGQVIWASERRIVTKSDSVDTKGLSGSQKVQTQEAFQSFAMHFGEGVAVGIQKMWQNKTLFFDISSSNTDATIAGYLVDAVSGFQFQAPTTLSPGVVDTQDFGTFRIYLGSYDQLPDPLIQSDPRIPAFIGGSPLPDAADYVPAHRGLVVVVFENWPLSVSANVIPQIEAIIVKSGIDSYPSTSVSYPLAVWRQRTSTWNADLDHIAIGDVDNPLKIASNTLRNFDNPVIYSNLPGATPQQIGSGTEIGNSRYYNTLYSQDSDGRLSQIDATRGTVKWTASSFFLPDDGLTKYIIEYPEGPLPSTVLRFAWDNDISAWDWLTGVFLWGLRYDTFIVPDPFFEKFPQIVGDSIYVPASFGGAAPARIYKINPLDGVIRDTIYPQVTSPPTADAFYDSFEMTYDPIINSFILMKAGNLRRYNLTTGSVDAPDLPAPFGAWDIRPDNNRWALKSRPFNGLIWLGYSSGDSFALVDVHSWQIIKDYPDVTTLWPVNGTIFPMLSPSDGCLMVGEIVDVGINYLCERLDCAGITHRSVVESVSARVGFPAQYLDATLLTDTFVGSMVGNRPTARSYLQTLNRDFNADVRQKDFMVQFFKHGGLVDIVIPEDDFGAVSSRDGSEQAPRLAITHVPDSDLNQAMDYLFVNQELDYNQDDARFERAPEATQARDFITVQSNVTFKDRTVPDQIAERLIMRQWAMRDPATATLPPEYMNVILGDILQSTIDGIDYRMMVQSRTLDPDLIVTLDLGAEDQSVSIPAPAPPVPPSGLIDPGQTIDRIAATAFDVIDSPYFRDADANDFIVYGAAMPTAPADVTISQSRDNGLTFLNDIMTIPAGADPDYGYAETILGDADYHFTDRTNKLRVTMQKGPLASVTRQQALEGENTAFMDGELFTFQNVTHVSGTTYDLDTFIRGRRGTESWIPSHTGNGLFIIVSAATLRKGTLDINEIGQTRVYTATPAGRTVGSGMQKALKYDANCQKPYAVNNVSAVRNQDYSWTIDWVPRTYLANSQFVDGLGTPILPQPEAYEIDLFSNVDGSFVKTRSAASPTTTFTYQDILDAGKNPANVDTLDFAVYQISPLVGRGFGARQQIFQDIYDPAIIDSLDRWYDASAGTISTTGNNRVNQWDDSGTLGRDMFQTSNQQQPTANLSTPGQEFVSFNGTSHNMPGADAAPFTGTDLPSTFAVVVQPAFIPGTGSYGYILGMARDNNPNVLYAVGVTDTNKYVVRGRDDIATFGIVEQTATITNPLQTHVIIVAKHATTVDMYVDAERVINNQPFDLGASVSPNVITMGAYRRTTAIQSDWLEGDIQDWLLFDTDLSPVRLTELSDYLHQKWGVPKSSSPDI